ncbi:MAG: hypothetical protein G01um101438_1037 [Parcubacteria group bacterium Gr01-1014_38]|nr:MAG: hypothetical protein G01um101438_1037 [Parcubacteria group bacterium Gr01-1014_38]
MLQIAFSVPSGAHHRSVLQPMRDLLAQETDWQFLIITPGAPWSDQLFPFNDYPRERFSFAENGAADRVLAEVRPPLVVTTTAGLDPADPPILETAKRLGLRTATVIESWDNVLKMARVNRGLGKSGQRIVLPDHLLVWNEIMKRDLLRLFPVLTRDQISIVGAPRLDYFGPRFTAQLPSKHDTLRAFDLDPSQRVLHLATTELYDHGHVARAIGEAKRRGDLPSDLQLYASVHPGGNMERHRPWAEQYGFTIRFSPGRHEGAPHPDFRYNPSREEMLLLVSLFTHTDIAVNLSSTVALESCVADRPVICAFFGKPFDWLTWRRSMVVRDFREHYADLLRGGGIAVARSPRKLIELIRTYLENPTKDREGRRRSAEIIATTLAGDASERVLHILKALVH